MGVSNDYDLIPDKLYFKIGEVCEFTGLKAHTLRYWESEFKEIKPKRAGSKQRLYRRIDVETLLQIKSLIYDDGHTIAGVKKVLARKRQAKVADSPVKKDPLAIVSQIKEGLVAIKKSLEK